MARTLPDYRSPPLVETLLGVQFDPIAALKSPYLGLLWLRFKEFFPDVEERPALEPSIERFGIPLPRLPQLRLLTEPPPNRVWFLKEGGGELIQVQQDRFIFNWRASGGTEYPRYDSVLRSFGRYFEQFRSFIHDEGLAELSVNQCEVTYVNIIEPLEGLWSGHEGGFNVLSVFRDDPSMALRSPERVKVSLHYPLRDFDGNSPLGRLRVELAPTVQEGERQVYRLTLTARGQPSGSDIADVTSFFNHGRAAIVRAFTELTTDRLHEEWGRTQ